MIRNDREYAEAVKRLSDERRRLAEHRERIRAQGLEEAGVARLIEPLESFHLQLQEEVELYERLKRGDLGELRNLEGLGRTLICLRIARGLTQRELAQRLGISESMVSRDERNEYHGITVERAERILETLNVRMLSSFPEPVLPQSPHVA